MSNLGLKIFAVSSAVFSFVSFASADDGWKNESQAGVVMTSGNTETTTLSFGEAASYSFTANLFKFTGAYLYQKTGTVVSAESWNLGLRYERSLSDRISAFLAETVEGNQFSGINQRYMTDLGAKAFLVKDEGFTWLGEGGYRFTKENLIVVQRNLHYARFYTELEKKVNATVSAKYWVEYLPNFTISNDWQLNTELSLSAALSSVFSIKSAYLIRYDNQVNAVGLVPTDRTLTTSLVAKF